MSTGQGRGNVWTGEAHKALVTAFARMHGTIKPDQQVALVKGMTDSGFKTSWEGIRQHLQKLKKKEGTEGTSEPGTPKKAGEATAAKGKKSTGPGNKRKRSNAHKLAEDEDEDEDDKKVMKKIKPEVDAPKFSLDLEDGLSVYEDGVI